MTPRDQRLWKQYQITDADYRRILEHQGGVCAICKCPPRSRNHCVDHDHKLGATRAAVRGVLCGRCNYLLGEWNDSLKKLQAAVAYMESPPAHAVLHVEGRAPLGDRAAPLPPPSFPTITVSTPPDGA